MIREFLTADSPEEALRKKIESGEGTVFLAGGTEVNRLGSSLFPSTVIALHDPRFRKIELYNGALTIGSCVTFQQLVDSPHVPAYLKEAALFCGSRTRRNMATIGGNIALQRDDSYLMATLVAAKARLVMADISLEGQYLEENIPIREYHAFGEHFVESLLVHIILNKPTRFVASQRFARTVQSPSAVTVSFGADISSGEPHDVRICAAVKGSGVVRFPEIEDGVSTGAFETPENLIPLVDSALTFSDDITGSADYKRYILGTAIADLYRKCLNGMKKGGTA
jgi:putative selenate reductase FAD-binding subunit